MADNGLPILPEKVPTLDAAEFERQQQALERNVGTTGSVGATTAAVAAAGGGQQGAASGCRSRGAGGGRKGKGGRCSASSSGVLQCSSSSSSAAAAATGDGIAIQRGNGDGTPTVRGAGGGRGPEPAAPQRTGGGRWEETTRVGIGECVDRGGAPASMATPGGEAAALEREGERENRQQSQEECIRGKSLAM